jgi:hypothetical protein
MPMNVLAVTVEQADIDGGCPGAARNCPVGRALARQEGGDWTVCKAALVGPDGMLDCPSDVAIIISRYDRTGQMWPFTALIPRGA